MLARTRLSVVTLASCLATLATLAPGAVGVASAEEPALETADGSDGCRAFREQNEREMHAFERAQPPSPYRYPREPLFLDAPWKEALHMTDRSGQLLLATLLPHVGAQFRAGDPAAYLAWPWTMVAFGPMYSCTRKKGTFTVLGHRAHRLLLEPAFFAGAKVAAMTVRPGYRFLWHPTSWVVGPGVGVGSTVEVLNPREPFRASISPELVAQFGACCEASYFTFAVRYDHFFAGNDLDVLGGSLGYTFF